MGEAAAGLLGAGADIGGAFINAGAQRAATDANINFNRELAKNGIQWKVEDAKAAGINPLYALGGSASSGPAEVAMPDDSIGKGVQSAGQDISRAISASMSPKDRAHKDAADALNLEHAKLSNDLLKVQISNASNREPVNPALPSDGSASGVGDILRSHARNRGLFQYSPENPVTVFGKDVNPADYVNLGEARRDLTDAYHSVHLYEWAKRILGGN